MIVMPISMRFIRLPIVPRGRLPPFSRMLRTGLSELKRRRNSAARVAYDRRTTGRTGSVELFAADMTRNEPSWMAIPVRVR